MEEDSNDDFWKSVTSLSTGKTPKLTHNKCPVCRKIHGKKVKGNRNTICDDWDCMFEVLSKCKW